MKIGESIQKVQALYSKGVQSDDSRLSARHSYSVLSDIRSTLINQKLNKKQPLNDSCYIILDCVELIEVDEHNCPCVPASDCKVLRTKHKLPQSIISMDTGSLSWVMSVDGDIRIDKTTRVGYRNLKGNKYTSGSPRYILEGGHLYLYGRNLPKTLKIKMIPSDSIEAQRYPNMCNGEEEPCINVMDMNFMFEPDAMSTLITMTYEILVAPFSQAIEDQTNDGRDNPPETSK